MSKKRFATVWLVAAVLGLAGWVGAAAPAGEVGVFRFVSLNRTYRQLAPEMMPVERGPVTVALSSPDHELTLTGNRLELSPRADGSYDAVLELEFAGRGLLHADVDVSGVRSRMEDDLVVPRQTRTLTGRVRIAPSAEGFLVTTEDLQRTFEVAIESRVGSQLVGTCASLAAFGLGAFDCDGLARAFSTAVIPMPPPGDTYIIEGSMLGEEGSRWFAAYLARTSRDAAGR